ncbi:MAG: H-NS histone family protein [Rhodobacteraceae bacterium]|nr:H-NS histone family protein [Paracoccaceae bacterium]
MPNFDYETLSLDELEQIQKDVTKAIALYHSRKRKEAKAKLDAVAKEFGFSSAEDLVGDKPTKAKKAVVPVFRNPEDHSQVCGGKGRKPNWFYELKEQGYTDEQLMIENQ